MNTERDNWKDVTLEDATDAELRLVHKIHGPKPEWMDAANWRNNMRACAKDIREHVALMANDKGQRPALKTRRSDMSKAKPKLKGRAGSLHRMVIQPGHRVIIVGKHPWAGYSGVVEERIVTLVGAMWRVNLDNGMNAGVDDANVRAV